MRKLAEKLLELIESGERGALATVIETTGSVPAPPGSKLLLCEDDTAVGTVGGGRIEHLVLAECREVIAGGEARTVRRHLARDLGMCCGGSVVVFVEPVAGAPRLVLFGAGHVGKATAEFATRMGFSVTVSDDREEWNNEERFPNARRIVMDPDEAVTHGELGLGSNTYVVIATHDHALDERALRACAAMPRRYLGMIGSKRKVIRTFQRVLQRSPDAELGDVYAPIGLDIGAVTPAEIGLAIVGELVAVRRGREATSMRLVDTVAGAARDALAADVE